MVRLHLSGRAALALTLAIILTQANRSESQGVSPGQSMPRATASGSTYMFYSLTSLGEDPSLGAFAAESLIRMFQAEPMGIWGVNYYPPKQLLVVHGNAAVQERVAAYLKDLRQAAATAPLASRPSPRQDAQVVQAGGAQPAVARPVEPVPAEVPSLATPRANGQPKHLLHFIMGVGVRYEGEGLIDSNVVEYAKASAQPGQSSNGASSAVQAVSALAGPLAALAGQSATTPATGMGPVSGAGLGSSVGGLLTQPPSYAPVQPSQAPSPTGVVVGGMPVTPDNAGLSNWVLTQKGAAPEPQARFATNAAPPQPQAGANEQRTTNLAPMPLARD